MRKASIVSAFLCGLSLLFLAATPASADPNAPGNNGTIKIHESPGEREPAMANDPHVCLFHIHGFKFDDNSTGEAWIESWPPTGNRSQVWHGGWSAGSSGEWRTGDIRLPDGHYKAYAKQMNEATPGGDKQKVFWVECGQSPGGGATGNSGGTGNGNSGGNGNGNSGGNGNGNSGGNGNGNSGGNGNGNSGGNGNGNGNSGGNSGGTGNSGGSVTTGGTTSTSGTTTTTTTASVSGSASAGVVAGVQSAPQAPQALAGVQSLPSTSTDTGRTPLVVLGVLILSTGVVLLRRPAVSPNQ